MRYPVLSSLFLVALLVLALPFGTAHAQEAKVPVIVLFKEKVTKFHTDKIESRHGHVKTQWTIINGLSTDLTPTDIADLKKDSTVMAVEQDLPVHATGLVTDQQIKADQVWSTRNFTGQGVPVAILDTGIDNAHPEFSGRIALCHSEITNTNTCQDQNGHGTHVAGIVGATGVNSNAKGVAPQVQYYIDQVLDSTGSGSFSGIISGIDWAIANHAKVISMSLGSTPLVTTAPNCDAQFTSLATAVNNAVASGITVVSAAGNSGATGVGAPGCMSNVIAVAAVDSTNTIASFSSVGGPLQDHGIAAPGVSVYSTYIPQTYSTLSGTSMATPAVSGTVALMLQANPSLTPAQVKSALFSTACTTSTNPSCPTGTVPNTSYGYGVVNALAAVNQVNPPKVITPPPTPAPSPDFTISSNVTSLSLIQGSSGQVLLKLTPSNGFTTLSLSAGTLPSGVTGTLNPSNLDLTTGVQTSLLTLSAGSTSTPGTYPVTITATGGSVTHSATVNLTITSAGTKQLTVNVSANLVKSNNRSFAQIVVKTSYNSTPVPGALVTVQVKSPSGSVAQATATTGSSGQVSFVYNVPRGNHGTYTVTATATATGYASGTATTSFVAANGISAKATFDNNNDANKPFDSDHDRR